MSARAYVFVLVLCEVTWLVCSRGTTAHLKDVFIGRCWQYQSISKQNEISVLNTKLNCTELWMKFYDSFAYKNPCEVNVSSYSKFFEMLDNKKKIYNVSHILERRGHLMYFQCRFCVHGTNISKREEKTLTPSMPLVSFYTSGK